MIVRVLGSAAGGGVPQWNCACANCAAARSGRQPRRTQSGLAISRDGNRWLLLNCSPDIAAQIEAFPSLHPRQHRGTPIAGVLLTDANVDHAGGLATLRQDGEHRFILRSSGEVRELLTRQTGFARFAQAPHRWLEAPLDRPCAAASEEDIVGNEIEVRAFPVPGTTPGYDGRRAAQGAVVAYEIAEGQGNKRLLFAPVFSAISARLAAAIASADIAFLDGTFFTDDELLTQRLMPKHASALGHQVVSGPQGTLAQLRGVSTKIVFTHVNNSNPILDPESAAFRSVYKAGSQVAHDGMEFRM
ncbi:MAG TPA: MBL fold metallo-hydrolase [Candidatus Cybelea sp.]